MPGLLRGVARTAVVAGTATAVSGRVQRRQAAKFADQDQQIAANQAQGWYQGTGEAVTQAPPMAPAPQMAPPPPPDSGASMIEQLKEFASLRDQGILTDEEFAAQKARLLGT